MFDYILAIGDHDPYGFSAPTDDAARRHAAEYMVERHWAEFTAKVPTAVTLAGPSGVLTREGEGLQAFCERINAPSTAAEMDDIQPADPVTPDCNTG